MCSPEILTRWVREKEEKMATVHKCGFCNAPLEIEWGAQIVSGKRLIIIVCAKCGAVLGTAME